MKKSPTFLKSQDTLNKTQLKSLGIERCTEARERHPNEALPITFVESKINTFPKMESVRSGADDHLKINRRGIRC